MSDSDGYSEEEIEDAGRALELIDSIRLRCDNAGIEYDDTSSEEDFGVPDVDFTVFLPSGRQKRGVNLWDVDDLDEFNKIDFEKYTIIGNYAAICCYETNTIEASFSIIQGDVRRSKVMNRRVLKAFGIDVSATGSFESRELINEDPSHKAKISIVPISDELKILTKSTHSFNASIIINPHKLSTHADAIKILEKVAHSIFFSVEVKNNIPLTLLRKRQQTNYIRFGREIDSIEYPKYEYESGPISLYWYARSAVNMPLLQFLAYYQVIEFYFPAYFKAEINRKVRSILKDPAFKIDRDSDMSRITSTIDSKSGRYGSEKEQLKATLRECVEGDDVQAFMKDDVKRFEFFTSKQKGITQYTINKNNRSIDLINQVADRVYDIRCKVVHVKSDDGDTEVELLLPYTEESEKLSYDVELVQFLAKKVLICSSTQFKI